MGGRRRKRTLNIKPSKGKGLVTRWNLEGDTWSLWSGNTTEYCRHRSGPIKQIIRGIPISPSTDPPRDSQTCIPSPLQVATTKTSESARDSQTGLDGAAKGRDGTVESAAGNARLRAMFLQRTRTPEQLWIERAQFEACVTSRGRQYIEHSRLSRLQIKLQVEN